MFFIEHTTPFEQKKGTVPYDVLMGRYLAAKDEILGEYYGRGSTETNILVGKTVYSISVDLWRSNEGLDGIYWTEVEVEANRDFEPGDQTLMEAKLVPLTWDALVTALCERFGLDPDFVWNNGVDVNASWSDSLDDAQDFKVPREADKARYTLARLHQTRNTQ